MKIVSIVGARPEFIQLAPLSWALRGTPHQHVVVHTGQHYDAAMSDVFFADLDLPTPDVSLGVGSGSHGVQTGAMLTALDPVLAEAAPDWVVVFGDTNSTLAGVLSAVKQHLRVAHVEAGLRSFNRRMPEEHNRVLTDHAADLLLAPTQGALAQLTREGLAARTVVVGDIKTEVTYAVRDRVAGRPLELPAGVSAADPYVLATLHRAENTDDPDRLAALVGALAAGPFPVVLPVHPRLATRAAAAGIALDAGSLHPVAPLAYPETVALMMHAHAVATDSGGVQKEAFLLRVPCVTLRTETEWVETVDLGWNVLVPDPAGLGPALLAPRPADVEDAPYGTGDTAARIVTELQRRA